MENAKRKGSYVGLDLGWIFTLFMIGFVGSMISGMVGIGGAIIKYPMLLYIPSFLGYAAFTAQEVSAVSAVQVFFAALAGLFTYHKGGLINKKLVLAMGVPIVAGSFLGGYGSKFLSDSVINITYAVMALVAAIMMFIPRKETERADYSDVRFHTTVAVVAAGIVGVLSGIVGAGGAFILVPIMLVILNIPTRVAIASSLAITFLSSIGAAAGKVMGGHLLLIPSIVMIAASVIASPLGASLGKKMNSKALRMILAVLIAATVIKIWFGILF